MLSGRSSVLHYMGKNMNSTKFTRKPTNYKSPTTTILVPLSLLSKDSVRRFFLETEYNITWIKDETNLNNVMLYTGGIPRILYSLRRWIKHNPSELKSFSFDNSLFLQTLESDCKNLFECPQDRDAFQILAELAWAKLEINVNKDEWKGEPITSVIARIGLYTNSGTGGQRLVVVPLLQLQNMKFLPQSLCSIAGWPDLGAQLEYGFMRIVLLRISLHNPEKKI